MSASVAIENIPALSAIGKHTRYISWAEFKTRYLNRDDGYKYEWVNGTIEKTKRAMDQNQYFILKNLRNLFEKLRFQGIIKGGFEAEIDTFFLEAVHRRPDISYFSDAQEKGMAHGEKQVPKFVVEIISDNDQMNRVHKKMQNYRDADVQVVWHIFPQLQEVHVYNGQNLEQMLVCKGENLVSASPILNEFSMSVNDIFSKN